MVFRHLRGGGSAPTAMQVTAIASAAHAKTAALPVLAQNTDPFGASLALSAISQQSLHAPGISFGPRSLANLYRCRREEAGQDLRDAGQQPTVV